MRGTEQALNVLGMSGTIEDKEDLPEDYEVERSFKFSTLIDMAEDCSTADDLVAKIRGKQEDVQQRLEEQREHVINQLEQVRKGDEVIVDSKHDGKFEGKVRSHSIDRGHVWYEVYQGRKKKGVYKDEFVKPASEDSSSTSDERDKQ